MFQILDPCDIACMYVYTSEIQFFILLGIADWSDLNSFPAGQSMHSVVLAWLLLLVQLV